jgi:hypothetical protein
MWLKNIPLLGNPGSQERQQSPPKMPSLRPEGGVDPGSLESINEGDPFSGGCKPKPPTTLAAYKMPSSSITLSELPWPNFAPHTYTSPFVTVPSTALVILCTSDEIQVHSTDQYTQFEA